MVHGAEKLIIDAPAKLNLFLEINGKRADGYHLLRSIVAPISLCDTLELRRAPSGITTRVIPAGLPDGNDEAMVSSDHNLVTRAALLLREVTGYRGGAMIRITKRIPIGGGLGGGSADAAATLVGLNRLWATGLGASELAALGARLGSDIPVLVHGRLAVMTGVGERIHPLPGVTARWWVVVVNPGFPVPTRDIYLRYDKSVLTSHAKKYKYIVSALQKDDVERASAGLFNALEPTVFTKYPLLAVIAAQLKTAGAQGVLLAGSGASIFAVARDQGYARALDRRIRRVMGVRAWSRVARLLPDGVIGSTRPFGG